VGCRQSALLAALLAGAALGACSDNQQQAPTEPLTAKTGPPSACDFQAVGQASDAEFTGATRVSVGALVKAMKGYAGNGDASNATYVGYQILDSVTHPGRQQGTPAEGSTLIIGLLKCMELGGATIPTSFTGPVGDTTGAIGVRGRSTTDAQGLLSHDGVWTIETPGSVAWRSITSTGVNLADSVKHMVLVYGNVGSSSGFTNDALLSTVYDWATIPIATFTPGAIVGQCTGDLGYIQHNSVSSVNAEVLSFVPALCVGATALLREREPRSFAERVGRLLSPKPAYAATLLAGGSGGTRGSLSPFGKTDPGAVNLKLEVQPNKSANQVGKPLVDLQGNPLAVAASSNGGTPFKQTSVFAWIEATSNNGVNVAACNNWAYSDANGRITFPTAYLNKAGGYTITIKTVGTDVSSSAASTPPLPPGKQPTSALFNVKNGTLATQCVTHDGTPPLPAPLQ
jgi:hypothetical protein